MDEKTLNQYRFDCEELGSLAEALISHCAARLDELEKLEAQVELMLREEKAYQDAAETHKKHYDILNSTLSNLVKTEGGVQ